jgi:hypothetical protein
MALARLLFATILFALLGGCSAPGGDPNDAAGDPVPASDAAGAGGFGPAYNVSAACTGCYEPAIAADAEGRLFVTAARLGGVAVSDDGGATWHLKPVPAPDDITGSGGGASDDVVQVAPWGTLFYSQMWSDLGGLAGAGLHVAGSDDGGETWPINTFIHLREGIVNPAAASDRQWLAFEGDSTVHLLYNCQASAIICNQRSDDGGRTFATTPTIVMTPADHSFPSPEGMPFIDDGGHYVVPYYADPRADTSTGARSIKVAISQNSGATWRHSTVYTFPGLQEGTAGGGWPHATFLADGSWVAGWSSGGSMYLARSSDKGASWSAPELLAPPETGGGGRPWLFGGLFAGQSDNVDAVWFGDGHVNWAHLPPLGSPSYSRLAGGGSSDYPYFTYLADGRVATAYLVDGDLRAAVGNL